MTIACNQFGVPQYPDSDARHLFVLLAAINLLERPTIPAVADLTSMPRSTIETGLRILQQQYGIRFVRSGEVIHVDDWGNLLREDGVMRCLKA